MAGMTGTHWYGITGRHYTNWGHGKVEKLTTSPTAMVAASGRAPKVWVDGGGDWREKMGAG